MKKSMRLILDANEYIFGLDLDSGQEASIRLLEIVGNLLQEPASCTLFVPKIIREEVQRNIAPVFIGDFYRYITSVPGIVYGSLYDVPIDLFGKYCQIGMKQADATIAAFADWVRADFLISENRHIYKNLKVDEFITCDAAKFIRLLDKGDLWQMIDARKTNPSH